MRIVLALLHGGRRIGLDRHPCAIPRGFAIKFYTEEGNWDLVGNNTPVFFIHDPSKFPDFIHSQKRHPQTGLRDAIMQWDFWPLSPESLHQVTSWLFGDRGIPATLCHMDGFGSHTYSLWNEKGKRYWVKWYFKTPLERSATSEKTSRVLDIVRTGPAHAAERMRQTDACWSLSSNVPRRRRRRYRTYHFDMP